MAKRWMIWPVAMIGLASLANVSDYKTLEVVQYILEFVTLVSIIKFGNWIEHLIECEKYLDIFKKRLFLTKHKDVRLLRDDGCEYCISYYDEEKNIIIYEFFESYEERKKRLKIRKDEGYLTYSYFISISDEIPYNKIKQQNEIYL